MRKDLKGSLEDLLRYVFEINGGQGRNRTADAGLFRAALYQLSYLAVSRRGLRSIEIARKSVKSLWENASGRNPLTGSFAGV